MILDYMVAKPIIEATNSIEEAYQILINKGYETDSATISSLWETIKGVTIKTTKEKKETKPKSKLKPSQVTEELLNIHAHMIALLSEIRPIPECKTIFEKYLKIVKEQF